MVWHHLAWQGPSSSLVRSQNSSRINRMHSEVDGVCAWFVITLNGQCVQMFILARCM